MTIKGSHGLTLFLLIAWDWLLQCAAFWDNRAQQLSKQMVFLTNDIALTNRYCCCQALERQDLSCTYLAHHELESVIIIIIIISTA